jgi:hypothetical protein
MKVYRGWLLVYLMMTMISAVIYAAGLILEAPEIMSLTENRSGYLLYFSFFTVISSFIKLVWCIVILYGFYRRQTSLRFSVILFELFCICVRLVSLIGLLSIAAAPPLWPAVISLGIVGISMAWIIYFARSVRARKEWNTTGNGEELPL